MDDGGELREEVSTTPLRHLEIARDGRRLVAIASLMGTAPKRGKDPATVVLEELARGFEKGATFEQLLALVREVNDFVRVRSGDRDPNEPWRGLGATLDFVVLDGARVRIAHAGDGHVLRWRAKQLESLTVVHSLANELKATTPTATAGDLAGLADVIVNAIGMSKLHLDVIDAEAKPGDVWMLCSNAGRAAIADAKLGEILGSKKTVKEKTRAVLSAAKGGRDEMAVVIVDA